MASPPYSGATSPSSSASLALPRQRPSLALPTNVQRRKPSITSATSSNHPLRQTSFPPPDSLEAQHQQAEDDALARFSPDADDDASLESDEDITSAISGPAAGDDPFSRKRKRTNGGDASLSASQQAKRARGRPPKAGTRNGSIVNGGDDARSTVTASRRGGNAPSAMGEAEDDDEDEDEDVGVDARAGGLMMDAAELEQENKRRYLFREAVPAAHQNRYDAYNKVKLRTGDVRRLVNATLSQSVPQNVVTVVGAYTKMFAGMLIESAREVQTEWMAVAAKQPDGAENVALRKLKMMRDDEEEGGVEKEVERSKKSTAASTEGALESKAEQKTVNGEVNHKDTNETRHDGLPDGDMDVDGKEVSAEIKQESKESDMNGDTNGRVDEHPETPPSEVDEIEYVQPGAWGLLKDVDESGRGPLLADHLREALRRYKKSRGGGSVGFTGLSLEGRDVAAPRMGGRRLFR